MEKELCWCGSGKEYDVCHRKNDERMQQLKARGAIVPAREMIKTPEQIAGIREACRINTALLDELTRHVRAGVSTAELDRIAYEFTLSQGAIPAPLGYCGFPKSICTSINDQVCHGIPSEHDILRSGDIVNIDVSTIYKGYYGDASRMFMIGHVNKKAQDLVAITKRCLELGIEAAKPWAYLGDIGAAISRLAHKHGYGVVTEYGGHGVGIEFHEDPFVSHVGKKNTGMVLVPGMIFTIEPMINMGRPGVYVDAANDWTAYTLDGSLSAQWEHQILITETGNEILSQ